MPARELLSEFRGVLVISREEGANLGIVSRIYIDPGNAKIACLTLGRKGNGRYIDPSDIISFGRDVVLVHSEAAVKEAVSGIRGRWL